MSPALMVAAIALELASCVCFVVICRLFFGQIPTTQARAGVVPMGSGALLPAGGAGSLAAVGWLLHFAECPQKQIDQRGQRAHPRRRWPTRPRRIPAEVS